MLFGTHAEQFLIDLGSMHSSSEVRFVLVFTMFFRRWTFCASNVYDTQNFRKIGLENPGPGRPGETRTSRFERPNDQVGRKSAFEATRSTRSRADRTGQGEPGRSAAHPRRRAARLQRHRWAISLLIIIIIITIIIIVIIIIMNQVLSYLLL